MILISLIALQVAVLVFVPVPIDPNSNQCKFTIAAASAAAYGRNPGFKPSFSYNQNHGIHSFLDNNLDQMRFVNNTVKCGSTKVDFLKTSFFYIWEVKGLLNYFNYLYNFDKNFTLQSEPVQFSSMDGYDGKWIFKLSKPSTENRNDFKYGKTSDQEFLQLKAEYTYDETLFNQQLNFGVEVEIIITNTDLNSITRTSSSKLFLKKPTNKLMHNKKVQTEYNLTVNKPESVKAVAINLASKFLQNSTTTGRRFFPSWFLQSVQSITGSPEDFANDEFFADIDKLNNNNGIVDKLREVFLTSTTTTTETSQLKPEKYETNQVTLEFIIPNIQQELDKLTNKNSEGNNNNVGSIEDVQFEFTIHTVYPYPPEIVSNNDWQCSEMNFKYHKENSKLDGDNVKMNKNPAAEGSNLNPSTGISITSSNNGSEDKGNPSKHDLMGTDSYNKLPPFIKQFQTYFNFTFELLEYSDMKIEVGRVQIPSHRVVLSNSSPTLSTIIKSISSLPNDNNNNYNTSSYPILHIDKRISLPAFKFVLEYLYTGELNDTKILNGQSTRIAEEIILTANLFGIQELTTLCENLLLVNLTVENCIRIYNLGKLISSVELMKKSVAVMKKNKHLIVSGDPEEFQKLLTKYPTLIFELFMS